MQSSRIPTSQEKQLIKHLVEQSTSFINEDWEKGLLVCSMNDGTMGSLYLFPRGKITGNRKFGKQVSEYKFTDMDGVDVVTSLNVDSDGNLFELDIWKTNFDKLISFPDL